MRGSRGDRDLACVGRVRFPKEAHDSGFHGIVWGTTALKGSCRCINLVL